MYAIIDIGGKQHRVQDGQTIEVDHMDVNSGDEITISNVILLSDDDNTLVGTPSVEGASVKATCVDQRRGKKVIVFKYKNKTRYRVKNGHRQPYTALKIEEILKPGKVSGSQRKQESEGAS